MSKELGISLSHVVPYGPAAKAPPEHRQRAPGFFCRFCQGDFCQCSQNNCFEAHPEVVIVGTERMCEYCASDLDDPIDELSAP